MMKDNYSASIQRSEYDITNMIPFYHLGKQYLDLKKYYPHAKKVLIVGVGDALLPKMLEKEYALVDTVDIDKSLNPTYLLSIENLSKIKKKYDVVICSNVLEHLPYSYFKKSILEMNRVSNMGIMITLPYSGIGFGFRMILSPFLDKYFLFKIPFFSFKKHNFDGQHYWEVGTKGFSIKKIISDINSFDGIMIHKNYYNCEWDYAYSFILKKKFSSKKAKVLKV